MTDPIGYFTKLLILDSETSGIAYGCDDGSYNPNTGEIFQSVSWGFIVVNAQTLKPIETLYLEIKWDGESQWNAKAEKIHGLSKEYLAQHGLTQSEAVEEIGNLIIKHWGPTSPVNLAGHNPQFDICFLKRLMRSEGIELRFAHRMVDTNSIGFTVYETYNSDDLFQAVGLPNRTKHNALEDAFDALKVLQVTRRLAIESFN